MTGLSSVAGAPLQAKLRDVFDAAQRGEWTRLNPDVANTARVAARMIRSAVQRAEQDRVEAERREADERASDDTARRTESPAPDDTGPTGQCLDVVA